MELVKNNNGKSTTTSLLVAEKFGKEHKHVLSAIDEIINGLDENSATLFFEESDYIHHQNKQTFRMYIMNRDGFTLLAMGFTGKKAMKFKMDYMQEFNKMESIIQNQSKPLTTLDILVQQTNALVEQNQRIDVIEEKIKYIEAKATTSPNYFAVAGYASLNGIAVSLPVAGTIGRMATKKCKDENIMMGKIHDPRFGEVNTYPMNVLEDVFKNYFTKNLN